MDSSAGEERFCPGCQRSFSSSPPADGILQCPYCGEQFFPSEVAEGETERPDAPQERIAQEELDGLRVRQIAALRRSGYRARSYWIVGLLACGVGGTKLLLMALHHIRVHGWGFQPVGYLLGTIAAIIFGGNCLIHALQLTRELRQSNLQEPEAAPDFSTLSDGSQRWKNLEEMDGGSDEATKRRSDGGEEEGTE